MLARKSRGELVQAIKRNERVGKEVNKRSLLIQREIRVKLLDVVHQHLEIPHNLLLDYV